MDPRLSWDDNRAKLEPGMVADTCNSNTQEVETDLASERPAWATWGVLSPCQLHSKTASQKQGSITKTTTLRFSKKIKGSPRGEALLRARPDLVFVRGSIWSAAKNMPYPKAGSSERNLSLCVASGRKGHCRSLFKWEKWLPGSYFFLPVRKTKLTN